MTGSTPPPSEATAGPTSPLQQQPPFVVFATPCYGGQVTVAFLSSMLKLQQACQQHGVGFEFLEISGAPLVTYARNELIARFLDRPHATHLMFIDADIGFDQEQVFRLLRFGADVTAGVYPRKMIDWGKVARAVQSGRAPEQAALHYVVAWPDSGPLEVRGGFARVRYVGAGFLLMRRQVLTRLCEAYPELRYRRQHMEGSAGNPYCYGLFETMIDPKIEGYLSEDAGFCRRWGELGGEIWVDTQSRLNHVGPIAFSGDLATQFEPVKAAGDAPKL
jgi:hypothetical protein